MQSKHVYPILILFLVFFVFSSPETAGPQARDFAGWIGEQIGNAGTFLEGLFADEGGTGSGDEAPATEQGDSFETLAPLSG